jgi:hypothetical protein
VREVGICRRLFLGKSRGDVGKSARLERPHLREAMFLRLRLRFRSADSFARRFAF